MPSPLPQAAAPKPVAPRARWAAAQRLAAGDELEQAAGFAGVDVEALQHLLDEDPGFARQCRAEERVSALPLAGRMERLQLMTWQAAERALAETRVSTVNLFMRGVLAPGREDADGTDDERDDGDADDNAADATDDEAGWLASLPPVEADPAREAERRRLLAAVEHKGLRKMVAGGTLNDLELFHAVGDPDPTAYEAWFARQPKPAFEPIQLSEEDRAAIAHVTRHNPPWIRGEYLGFYRKPVPRELFEAGAKGAPANDDAGPPALPAALPVALPVALPAALPTPAASQLELLRARVARLLDRGLPRLPDELDLAEAVCALKWPKWPGYAGAVDLDLLRLALRNVVIDTETLNWLGGHEIAKACRAAADPP